MKNHETLLRRRGRSRDQWHGVLLACALAFPRAGAAQQKVPLVLHHLIARIDSTTYHDIISAPFIHEQFSAMQTPFFNGVDGGSGIRMFGKYNFLQLAPGVLPASPTGDVGVVLASEQPGGLEQIQKQGAFLVPAEDGPVTIDNAPSAYQYFEFSNRLRPAGDDSTSAHVEFQLLQYSTRAVMAQYRIDSLPPTNLSNARFLSRFFDPKKLFSHLTGATLAISVGDIARIVRVLQRDGVPVLAEGEGAIIKLDGFTLHLIPPYAGAGVKQLQFALTRSLDANPIYRFGPRSRLRFGPGATAIWDF